MRTHDAPRRLAPEGEHEQAPDVAPMDLRALRSADAATRAGVISGLQRSAGNAAVSRLLDARRDGVLARHPVATGAAPSAGGLTQPTLGLFTPEDRQSLINETLVNMPDAFSAFLHACDGNITSMKAMAKARAETVALVIDIGTGFLAPAFATWQSTKLLGRLSERVANSMQVVGQEEKLTALIAKADILKAAFTGATKIAGDQIKRRSTVLFGETTEELILDGLADAFQVQVGTLAGQLPSKEDATKDVTLLALWHAYDPNYANTSMYKEAVKRLLDEYAAYIASIGEFSLDMHNDMEHTSTSASTRPYYVDAFGRKRVVLLTELNDSGEKRFKAWVPAEWEEPAVLQATQSFGAVPDVDLADVTGSIPTPGP